MGLDNFKTVHITVPCLCPGCRVMSMGLQRNSGPPTVRRFKPLGIGLKVVATEEKFAFAFSSLPFFVDFNAIYDICRLPSVEPRVLIGHRG